jgi:ribose transport system ATP-binding protein
MAPAPHSPDGATGADPAPVAEGRPALVVRNLSKTFVGVRALKDVTIPFRRGAVTALLGPNGCGKSTLIKILAGFHEPDEGSAIELAWGAPLQVPINPRAVFGHGLRFVHQDLGLVHELSITDNLAFVDEYGRSAALRRLPSGQLRARAQQALDGLSLDIDPVTPVGSLSRTDQIMVAIARAFQSHAGDPTEQIVILDEPTASLPSGSVERVLGAVEEIRRQGGTVIYVTHRIDEVTRIADDVAILRDGSLVTHQQLGDMDAAALAKVIIGARLKKPSNEETHVREEVALSVEGLTGNRILDVAFSVRQGEIFGVAGLAGCGRSELARILAGAQQARAGSITIDGREVAGHTPREALDAGVAFVPPERTRYGCIPDLSLRHNIALSDLTPFWARGILRQKHERGAVAKLLDEFDVRPRDTERRMSNLSGGNQQKAVIAKFARLDPRVMVVDEPTQGVDVAGKADIGEELRRLARGGCAVIVASSDFDEIGALCDRVLVLDRGEMIGIFDHGTVDEERLAVIGERHERKAVPS